MFSHLFTAELRAGRVTRQRKHFLQRKRNWAGASVDRLCGVLGPCCLCWAFPLEHLQAQAWTRDSSDSRISRYLKDIVFFVAKRQA